MKPVCTCSGGPGAFGSRTSRVQIRPSAIRVMTLTEAFLLAVEPCAHGQISFGGRHSLRQDEVVNDQTQKEIDADCDRDNQEGAASASRFPGEGGFVGHGRVVSQGIEGYSSKPVVKVCRVARRG